MILCCLFFDSKASIQISSGMMQMTASDLLKIPYALAQAASY
jgi:hypothetical protein